MVERGQVFSGYMIRRIIIMHFSHEGYFTYELPNGWCSEDSGENLLIYDPNGDGAMTISFFSILDMNK